jgi:hypothetical protein
VRRTKRTLSPADRNRAGAFRRAVAHKRCAVCGADSDLGPVISVIDAHHVVSARECRSRGIPVYDPRNALPICRQDHEHHENAAKRIPRSVLTEENWEFAREHGLEWYIERYYPEAEAA